MKNLLPVFIILFLLFGCAPKKKQEIIVMKQVGLPEQQAAKTMKQEILIGMSQEDVRKALGSPDIVAKDKAGREIWVLSQVASSVKDIKKNGKSGILVDKENDPTKKKETSEAKKELLSIVVNFGRDKNVTSLSYH